MQWRSRRVAKQFHEAVPYRPTTQNAKRLKQEGDEINQTADCQMYLEFETKHGHCLGRRNKAAEKNEEMKA
ncbi:hypothetical protein H5410_030863 [Solanum commersonii]|uniref:Uncharacterized protein n=1 Tax=Solanum commersonii TaxID=4109 RepID=A0A9J5YHF7_SOLCO|nr:hypothetical protein H5410_030863 [Solanum commersonii]